MTFETHKAVEPTALVPSGTPPLNLLHEWNRTRTEYPRDKTVAWLFEEVAGGHSGSIALAFGKQQVTYAELNARANQLAHHLRKIGAAPESMVGCCMERSIDFIVSVLAVLKTGAAYVPLDPAYPSERLSFLIGDTRAPLILTQRSIASTVLSACGVPLLSIDEIAEALSAEDTADPPATGSARSLAYVMYTSGSTGRPKGTLIENRSISRLVRDTNFCRFGPDEVFLQFAPTSFDASTFEIWGALLNGGRLAIMPSQTSSLADLGQAIREHGVTTLWLTAGLFSVMVEERLDDLRSVHQLLAGGDVLSTRHVRTVLENLPDCTLINGYGPTENTTFTCCYPMRYGVRVPESIPIGRPISNTRVYILDEQRNPLGPGEAGELYAAGDGVARGYLNNPAETAEKFLSDPFSPAADDRMYRTGDLARWRPDGVVEFVGRIDQQVKILGHRIEPGEVESVLGTHKGVQQVSVVAHTVETGLKRLVAYYVPSANVTTTPVELRSFLSAKLPEYMVPAVFVSMPSLPLSPNGKVDRSALPPPVFGSENQPAAADQATPVERTILDLWRRVLRVERVGMDDNFFDAGGDSLLLVAVHSNLQRELQTEIPVTDLFEFPTIRTLARHLSEKSTNRSQMPEVEQQARQQRDAFARLRERRPTGTS